MCALASNVPDDVFNQFCTNTFPLDGSAESCGVENSGYLSDDACTHLCPLGPSPPVNGASDKPANKCFVQGSSLQCDYAPCGTGRRPPGLEPLARDSSNDAVADVLARIAHLEAASVPAFRRLSRELARLGAPATLVARARRAARDETRHARVMTVLARRRGASVPRIGVRRTPKRDVETIAIDNAVEGCVVRPSAPSSRSSKHHAPPTVRSEVR